MTRFCPCCRITLPATRFEKRCMYCRTCCYQYTPDERKNMAHSYRWVNTKLSVLGRD